MNKKEKSKPFCHKYKYSVYNKRGKLSATNAVQDSIKTKGDHII